jgi:hypothetical protein
MPLTAARFQSPIEAAIGPGKLAFRTLSTLSDRCQLRLPAAPLAKRGEGPYGPCG